MGRRKYLDDFTCWRKIGKLGERCSLTSVAKEVEMNKSVTSRAYKTLQTNSTSVRKVDQCRPRKTTVVDDRYILLQLFLDDSRYYAKNDSQRHLIWREVGKWFHPSNITKRDSYDGSGFFAWPLTPNLKFQGEVMKISDSTTYLGCILDSSLNWKKHAEHLKKKKENRLHCKVFAWLTLGKQQKHSTDYI
ncbi:hypothetical protein TNCV_1725161 [Trichonephila clavipes]|nr:hypothetical protein TNCV_1725161 [Trichonephila clavipes]